MKWTNTVGWFDPNATRNDRVENLRDIHTYLDEHPDAPDILYEVLEHRLMEFDAENAAHPSSKEHSGLVVRPR